MLLLFSLLGATNALFIARLVQCQSCGPSVGWSIGNTYGKFAKIGSGLLVGSVGPSVGTFLVFFWKMC